jgi:hypothetical protein
VHSTKIFSYMKLLVLTLALTSCSLTSLFSADNTSGAVVATVKNVDKGRKTVVVKTGQGVEHTFHFVGRTIAHGAESTAHGTATGSKDAFDGVKQGDQVVVHYTEQGGVKTADEVDHLGKEGMKATVVSVKTMDRGDKTVGVKTADGAEQSWRLTDRAAVETGKGIEKGGKVTAYYTEEAGKKVVHFFSEN